MTTEKPGDIFPIVREAIKNVTEDMFKTVDELPVFGLDYETAKQLEGLLLANPAVFSNLLLYGALTQKEEISEVVELRKWTDESWEKIRGFCWKNWKRKLIISIVVPVCILNVFIDKVTGVNLLGIVLEAGIERTFKDEKTDKPIIRCSNCTIIYH